MWKSIISVIAGAFAILCICDSVFGVDEESAKELKCLVPETKDVSLDYDWILSNTDWYFPIQSRLDLYRTSWDILRKAPSDISEQELKSACIRSHWEGFTPSVLGFSGKKFLYEFTPMEDNIFIFTATWRDGDGGKMYLTKTDNKSYIVFVKCWDDGEMSWNAMSTLKNLESGVQDEILEHVRSLGFKDSNVVQENYETCNWSGKNEL